MGQVTTVCYPVVIKGVVHWSVFSIINWILSVENVWRELLKRIHLVGQLYKMKMVVVIILKGIREYKVTKVYQVLTWIVFCS